MEVIKKTFLKIFTKAVPKANPGPEYRNKMFEQLFLEHIKIPQ